IIISFFLIPYLYKAEAGKTALSIFDITSTLHTFYLDALCWKYRCSTPGIYLLHGGDISNV
ncbi:hypothetical protein, partial [Bacteroides heparinolyticus]|uniref:hypothetical protein n=1 Tax=Prevotella heparinolytica TaxID=28113 RepID=UPI0035A0B86D